MDWKKRRTLPSQIVRRVAVVGGTHGNETNGVYLAKHVQRMSSSLQQGRSFEIEVVLSNTAAIAQNTRYVDEDLNRMFLLEELLDDKKATLNRERARAREVDALLGPKSSSEPRCDLVIDLHNTTAATGIALIMAPDDAFAHELAWHLMTLDEEVRVANFVEGKPDWATCSSEGRSGMTFEVGPCPWGCLEPALFERSKRLLLAMFDYVEAHNRAVGAGAAAWEPFTIPVYRSIGVNIEFPRGEDGDLAGMIHPELQGRDFLDLKEGAKLFRTFSGEDRLFFRKDYKVPEVLSEQVIYPVFVNEAAYYEKNVACMLFVREEKTFNKRPIASLPPTTV